MSIEPELHQRTIHPAVEKTQGAIDRGDKMYKVASLDRVNMYDLLASEIIIYHIHSVYACVKNTFNPLNIAALHMQTADSVLTYTESQVHSLYRHVNVQYNVHSHNKYTATSGMTLCDSDSGSSIRFLLFEYC